MYSVAMHTKVGLQSIVFLGWRPEVLGLSIVLESPVKSCNDNPFHYITHMTS